jgi:hypothetical protein
MRGARLPLATRRPGVAQPQIAGVACSRGADAEIAIGVPSPSTRAALVEWRTCCCRNDTSTVSIWIAICGSAACAPNAPRYRASPSADRSRAHDRAAVRAARGDVDCGRQAAHQHRATQRARFAVAERSVFVASPTYDAAVPTQSAAVPAACGDSPRVRHLRHALSDAVRCGPGSSDCAVVVVASLQPAGDATIGEQRTVVCRAAVDLESATDVFDALGLMRAGTCAAPAPDRAVRHQHGGNRRP